MGQQGVGMEEGALLELSRFVVEDLLRHQMVAENFPTGWRMVDSHHPAQGEDLALVEAPALVVDHPMWEVRLALMGGPALAGVHAWEGALE